MLVCNNQAVAKVRFLATGSGCLPYGCRHHPMDSVSTSLRKSALESHLSRLGQDQTRMSPIRNSSGTLLAECSLVPSDSTHGFPSLMDAATTSGAADLPFDTSPSATAELDTIRVKIIRTQLLKKELNA